MIISLFLIGFFLTFIFSIVIVLTKPLHSHFSIDTLTGDQKFHTTSTPRIGGIAIVVGLLSVILIFGDIEYFWLIVLTGLPVFTAGLCEDMFKSVPSSSRLIAAIISAILFCFILGDHFTYSGIYLIDQIFTLFYLWPVLTVIAIAALTNGINIIDGFNGLASGATIVMAACIYVLATGVGDFAVMQLCIIFMSVLCGFFAVNFPRGYLFLGDAGAYFCGFFLAALSILLITRNPEIPPLALFVIFAYPMVELLFSIYRKTNRKGHRADRPDKVHFHMLVFRSVSRLFSKKKIFRNAITGGLMLIFPLSSFIMILLVPLSRGSSLLFLISFTLIYLKLYKRFSLQ